MGCGCHGDARKSTSEVRPYDQCLICARKHVVQAWQAWHEFGHELDNRDFCSAELRACAAHVKYIERDIAIEGGTSPRPSRCSRTAASPRGLTG